MKMHAKLAAVVALSLAAVVVADEAAEAVENLLTEPADPANWFLEQHAPAAGELTQADDALHLKVSAAGEEPWHVQFYQPDLALEDGKEYIITFDAKADAERKIQVSASQQVEPWNGVGLWTDVEIGEEWEAYELYFTAENVIDGKTRAPVIAAGLEAGDVWVRNVTLVEN